MKYLASLLVLLPLATAEVARLKLHKIPQVSQNPVLETAYLASKYGVAQPQIPLMGSGGSGRRLRVDDQDDDLFWTQEEAVKPGHTVPLTSTCPFCATQYNLTQTPSDFMNAQYFAEISLGTPPQPVSYFRFASAPGVLTAPSRPTVQGHPGYRVRDSPHQRQMPSSQRLSLGRVTSGFPAASARLSRASFTRNTIPAPLQLTRTTELVLKSTMVLVLWKASCRMTFSTWVTSQ